MKRNKMILTTIWLIITILASNLYVQVTQSIIAFFIAMCVYSIAILYAIRILIHFIRSNKKGTYI